MLRFFCSKLPQKLRHIPSKPSHANFFSTYSRKPTSELPNPKDPQSLTVSFVQNSCELSFESAILYSKKLNIENVKNTNSVLDLLRNHGLTQTHISNIIRIRPLLLSADLESTLMTNMEVFESLGFSGSGLARMLSKYPAVLESDAHTVVEFFRAHGFSDKQITTLTMKLPSLYMYNADKNFKPKLEFFKSLGLSDLEIARLLSSEPYILTRSLEKQIIPCVQELRRVLGTDENVLKAIKACYQLLESNMVMLQPNIDTLKTHGVPQSLVLKLFFIRPMSLLICSSRFSEIVSEVMKLGFDPNYLSFLLAIRSMALNSKPLWEQKVEAFRSFGLSEDEVHLAFKRHPLCMSCSEKKIKKMMGFFVNKLKMKPSVISKNPCLLLYDLEKRIIPRYSVMQVLMLKGLIKEDIGIVYMVKMAEKEFMVKFVSKYQNEVPDVVRAYQGKIEFQGLGASPICHAHLFSTSSLKPISDPPNSTDPKSLTVSFLRNSCGLCLELATSASKKLNIENVENLDSILNLLRTHGLTQNHIKHLISSRPLLLSAELGNTLKPNMELFKSLGLSGASLAKMLSKYPAVLESDANTAVGFFRAHGFSDKQIKALMMKRPLLYTYNAHKIFKPKFEFFKSLGLSDLEIAEFLAAEPYVLERSLEKQIIPCVQELRRTLGTDENVLKVIKARCAVFNKNVVQPNIATLISHGVPLALVLKLFFLRPMSLRIYCNRFSEIVNDVMKLGFEPNSLQFVLAIGSMAQNGKTSWEQKVEAFRSFDLSEDEIYAAFKRHPKCMSCSEKKIKKMMDFYVNKLKMKPSKIFESPSLLQLSLEKRIIPRCSVLQVLMFKGLITEDTSIVYIVKMAEKNFMKRFVSKYQNDVPDVVRAHQGKIQFQGLPVAPMQT